MAALKEQIVFAKDHYQRLLCDANEEKEFLKSGLASDNGRIIKNLVEEIMEAFVFLENPSSKVLFTHQAGFKDEVIKRLKVFCDDKAEIYLLVGGAKPKIKSAAEALLKIIEPIVFERHIAL